MTTNHVQVGMVVRLWRAGESLDAVAQEYGLTRDVAEAICPWRVLVAMRRRLTQCYRSSSRTGAIKSGRQGAIGI